MSKKPPSIVGPPLEALTSNLSNGQSVSGRINSAAERYLEILKRPSLGLSESERVILARYWYRKAGRVFPGREAAQEEIAAALKIVCAKSARHEQ